MNEIKSPILEMEENVLSFWDKAEIFKLSLAKDSPKGDYVFYDGPPFATGTPHYGHLVASLMKDTVPRFWTMKGYHVERKWGWDCHGLPIENIVEKELGSKSKKDIEAIGIDKFNETCRSKVLTYAGEWQKTIHRLGRFVDMENPYSTMDKSYMESVWWVFKNLWDKNLVYESYRSMHICPRCETTLSQSEVAEGYRDVKDLSCIAKFELVEEPGTFVLAWTTTPWTLIGNVALAIKADTLYCQVHKVHKVSQVESSKEFSEDEQLILAKERLADVLKEYEYEVVKEIKGADLVGKKYQPLFDYYATDANLKNKENGWQITAGEFVTTEDGTGVVHIAPAFGEDDMNLGKEKNLPFIQHVGMDGLIKAEAKEFAGLSVKPIENTQSTDIEIIKYLAGKNLLFSKAKYEHSYPHCWRCDTPLLNYATSSYFVKVLDLKEKALANAEQINWSPEHIKEGRFGQWLAGARDWSISRQRFWASVIPLWKCSACAETEVFGSAGDLEQRSGQKIDDLHKHIVDKIIFPCSKCQSEMKRIPDVLDTWFDSASMPYAQMHYPFENKEKFEVNFPAQFIAEGVDQTRAWFYYMHIIASGLFDKPAFKNVIVNGIALAEDGKKMSKKLQNYPDPNLILDTIGADALRMYLLASPVMQAENLNFSQKGVEEALRKNIMLLWNVYKFYETYAEGTTTASSIARPTSTNVLDNWLLIKLNELIAEVGNNLEGYNLPRATRAITEFIDEFSTWYLRRSRDRLKDSVEAVTTMRFTLLELAKVMAPFAPFIAETVWQKTTNYNFADNTKSVHLEAWPDSRELNEIENKVLTEMLSARKIVELGLAARDEAKIKIRQPLAEAVITGIRLDEQYYDIIQDELNIKQLSFAEGELAVKLDTVITEELKTEGLEREVVRFINNLRKDLDLTVKDKALVYHNCADEKIAKIINGNKNIMNSTAVDAIEFTAIFADGLAIKNINIDGTKFDLALSIKK